MVEFDIILESHNFDCFIESNYSGEKFKFYC